MDVIGKKNRLVEFYKPAGNTDAGNEPTAPQWIFFKRKWASILGETGMGTIRSSVMAGNTIGTPLNRYSFRVDYDPSINESMQVRDRTGMHMDIITVRHDLANREWTDVIAEVGGANG